MSLPQDVALERIQAAVVDGRAETIRHRQDQLQALHKALREEAGPICSALAGDSWSSTAEVETEYYLGMDAVRHFYESIDFKKELEIEYLVANGKDNPRRRVGVGLVLIRPTSFTRFYSIMSPLAAAMAAGNSVVLEIPDSLLQVDAVLRTTLTKALDPNTFYISKEINILDSAVVVDQTSTTATATTPPANRVISSSGARAIAVVDRSADIDAAAKAITTARFSFGGHSPYAPDLVLVNEFVKKDFFEACSKYASLSFARDSQVSLGAKKVSGNASEDAKKEVQEAEDRRQVSTFGSSEFKLVDVLDRDAPITKLKISGRYLLIATVSGLVDAIFTHPFERPLLAGYFFAAPRAAKYLSQHLECHVSAVNQIPPHLLVGPAAPLAHPPAFLYRYARDMFSAPRPQFVEPPPAEPFDMVGGLLLGGGAGGTSVSVSTLRARAVALLKPTGQPKNEQLGFFESGFFLGASITLPVALPLLGYTTYLMGRRGLEFALRWRH